MRRRGLLCEKATGESNTKEEIIDKNVNNGAGCVVIKLFVTLSGVVIDYTTLPEGGRQNNKNQEK